MTTLRTLRYLPLALLAVEIGATLAGAENPPGTPESRSPLVGDLGRREALVFEGNKTFTREKLLRGLSWHVDFHVASHRAAPLEEYRSLLRRQITAGYQRAGFPEVTVETIADTSKHKMVIRVNEGQRYDCGDLLLSGMKGMTNEAVREKISDALTGLEPTLPASAGLDSALWQPGKPAPLDEMARDHLTARVQEALAQLDYLQPKIRVRVVPDQTRQRADLKVEMIDEGIKGRISEIEVTGLRVNTRAQVLEHLKLKPGVDLRANMVATISNQLWQSARFFRQDVALAPLGPVGQFKLTLDLDEVREAPPLSQELSDKERALLKFRDWLAGWEKRPEDFVISLGMTNSLLHYRADMTLSPSGFALAIRDDSSNQPPKLHYAVVASEKMAGFYSVWRRSKYAFQRAQEDRGAQVLLQLRPSSQRSYGQGNINLAMKVGVPSSQPPFRLEMDLEPAVFLSMAYENSTTFKDGVLTLSNMLDDVTQEVRVKAETGRLLQFALVSGGTNGVIVHLDSKEGAFAGLLREIASATAEHPNQCLTNLGFISWLSFMTTDVIESPLVERVLDWFAEETAATGQRAEPDITSHRIKTMLALAREVAPRQGLDRFFEPLSRLFRTQADDTEEDEFSIPVAASTTKEAANSSMAMVAAFALNSADDLFPRDAWPWILFRETAFTLSGNGRYAQTEMEQLLKSEDLGPIGCLVTAYLWGKSNPRLARTFAERGLKRLTPAAFRKDYRTLMQTNSIAGALAGNALASVSGLTTAQLTTLVAKLAPDETALVRQLTQSPRALNDGSASEAAWPDFEQYWNKALSRHIETRLSHFLPQVQFLTNSQALYERGLALISSESAFQDFDEAAQCFRKAADQGHGGAQLQLGVLSQIGKGVPEDFAEAMRWYQEAAKQKELHAACSIAGLYHDGKGVRQDLAEAIKWYRLDADRDCTGAQFNLGRILESQLETDESLKWYRRAAEGGAPAAQARLGDMLSDGFSAPPDYVEACQWLTLAADGGDKLSEIRLRRVKAKLSVEQLKEAQKRSADITQRLEEQQKKTERARSGAGIADQKEK